MDRLRREESRAGLTQGGSPPIDLAGRSISRLARLLLESGNNAPGSDHSEDPAFNRLRLPGLRIHAGHERRTRPRGGPGLDPETVRGGPGRPPAISAALMHEFPSRWIGQFVREKVGLAVAGQRDAGVASAMIAWTLTCSGLDPTVLVGTPVPQLGGWTRIGSGAHFVVEAFGDAGWLAPLPPRVAILLNVASPDGVDPSMTTAALRRLAVSVPVGGLVLASEPNSLVASAVHDLQAEVERISLERGSVWWGTDLREERGRYRFRAFHRGRFAVEVRLQVPGRRNVLSALAAIAACGRLGVPAPEIKQSLEEFTGLARNFESRGSYRGVTLVDDESEDPCEVSDSLAIGRQVFGPRRLWAVFLADGRGRQDEEVFAAALASADEVLIMDQSLEHSDASGEDSLVRRLIATGVSARRVESVGDAIRELDRHLEPGDVLVTLGSGDVGTIADALIRRLSRDRQGR